MVRGKRTAAAEKFVKSRALARALPIEREFQYLSHNCTIDHRLTREEPRPTLVVVVANVAEQVDATGCSRHPKQPRIRELVEAIIRACAEVKCLRYPSIRRDHASRCNSKRDKPIRIARANSKW